MLGVTWGPDQASHCHSDRFTAPGWDLRGAEEEVLRLRLATCITIVIQVARLRWPSTDWFSATWLPHRKPSCIIDFWCGAGKADAQTFACLLELAGQESRCSMWPKLNFSPCQWRPFFCPLPSLPPGAGAIWNIPWCLVSDLQLACPVTSAHYCCISLRPLLNEDWDKAGSEWTAWSHRPEAGAPRSNVPPKYLSAS